jgi:predicted lipid-binding transport protein (Tim44 family)
MKKMFMAALIAVMAISIGVSNAEAKRLGGGSSFGKQSQSVQRSAPMQSSPAPAPSQAANAARPTPPAAVPPKPASPWKGILGGALLGLGLGALLSHLGMGGALASMISTMLMIGLLALAAMFIYRMLRRKSGASEPTPAFAGTAANRGDYGLNQERTPEIGSGIGAAQPAMLRTESAAVGEQANNEAPWGVPADFDKAGFLRHAKTYFIRLQAAWDKADINDIREFTTPEMFSEIRMQISERGATANHTDVVSLDAQLLGIETSGNNHLASVKFTGMIRESENAPAEPFAEVWNLSKPVSGQGGWTLAGIQQLT